MNAFFVTLAIIVLFISLMAFACILFSNDDEDDDY